MTIFFFQQIIDWCVITNYIFIDACAEQWQNFQLTVALPFINFYLNVYIVYWTHFQNIHTFIYQNTLLLTLFYLFSKLLKAFIVSLRTNVILHHIKKHYSILIINQSRSIKTIYFQIYFIYTIKWGVTWTYFWYIHFMIS